MAYYIALPLKKTSEVDLVKPLKNLIASNYNTTDDAVDYTDALNELNKLRMNSTWRTLDKHESSLEVMCRYYDQLVSLESKCPPSDIQIPFKWKDAFEKGTVFYGPPSLTISSLAYEKVCILFNIAAMQSQIAASQGADVHSDESLRTASKYFQLSSGIFYYLRNSILSAIQQDPTPDLQPDTLSALQILMLAQAQETFFHKVVMDKMKNGIIAKVASQCEEHYAEALKQMQKESTRTLWEKDWITVVGAKQAQFRAVAEYYQSLVCKEEKEIGEELARLQLALELIKTADSRAGTIFSLKEWVGRIHRAFEETKKDNDFIYHARIPDPRSLAPVPKAALAKPAPLPDKMSPNSHDLFAALLPVSVQQAVQKFDLRKNNLVNIEVSKLKEQTQMMNGILASLNLPAAIEDVSGDSIPQSLKDKANTIREKGGLAYVARLIEELPELLQRNKEILDEADRMLREEEDTDNQLRTQFKDKWTRTPSSNLNAPLKANIAKYQELINNAMNADAIVREKYNKHKDMIDLLSKSEEEMLQAIPSAAPAAALSSSSCVQELRRLMAEVEEIKRERETLEEELKTATVDMKAKFLSALAEDGALNEEVLSTEALGETFAPIQKLVRENLERQERVMAQVQAANTEFCKEKDTGSAASQREAILRDLAAAHDAYVELCSNLEEGKKFYNDLTEILLNFQSKISDFCYAREIDREETCKNLQKAIVSQVPKQTPTPPAHHASAGAPKSATPPPRPPPPAASSAPPYVPPAAATTGMAYPPQAQPVQASTMGGVVYPPYQNVQYYYPPPALPNTYNPYAGQQPVPYPPTPYQQTTYVHPYPGYPQQQQPGAYQYPQQRWN